MTKHTKEEYYNALAEYNKAFDVYNTVRARYHAREIGDEEFLAARAIFDALKLECDRIESLVDFTEPVAAPEVSATQLDLF